MRSPRSSAPRCELSLLETDCGRLFGRCFRPAQFAELETLGELTARAVAMGVQVMVEGLGTCRLTQMR